MGKKVYKFKAIQTNVTIGFNSEITYTYCLFKPDEDTKENCEGTCTIVVVPTFTASDSEIAVAGYIGNDSCNVYDSYISVTIIINIDSTVFSSNDKTEKITLSSACTFPSDKTSDLLSIPTTILGSSSNLDLITGQWNMIGSIDFFYGYPSQKDESITFIQYK